MQPACNISLKIFALNILNYFSEDIFHEEPDYSSFKTNEAIPNNRLCEDCDMSIFSEDPSRSPVINICNDIIHQTYVNKVDNRDVLPYSYGVVDYNDPFLPLEKVSNNSNKSHKWTNVKDTSSKKKVKTKNKLKSTSPMLKKLIEKLKTLLSSIKDNSESQPKAPGSITDLHKAIIEAKRKTVTNNHKIIRAYYSFGKKLKNRLTFHIITNSERRAQRKLNDKVGEQLPNYLS
ncbi:hypothetical protein C1645_851922 [Glomus cerebriforme]|uniref:Uncharacterized protein n=1 Tax=Glomus cerebriforme TaxID=658196 RepID=A0A397ST36_9GLOM|nr:hypothetical protein C1645_851922 [Glomus cerebriforme]